MQTERKAASSPLPSSTGSATETGPRADEIDIVAVLKLPLPVGAFVGAMRCLQADYPETLYIRNCFEGYEVYKLRAETAKTPNSV